MYRVVTIYFQKQGLGRKRVVSKGPLHPDMQHANRWAAYLRQAGDYYDVRVESGNSANATHLDNHRTG
ncbi:MAG: hypothetical protein IPN06_16660 [Burkholderiales bacterium]|jgi:hypothetical protein|nr:hypothetical protein [Burkholderiales bacterium]